MKPRPWGPLATLAFGAIASAAFFVALFLTYTLFDAAGLPDLKHNPIAMCAALTAGAGAVLIALGTAIRARTVPFRTYLALRRPRLAHIALAAAFVVIFLFAASAIGGVLGRPQIPTYYVPLLPYLRAPTHAASFFFAIVLVAPLYEEFAFRGFLLAGFERYGAPVATLVSATIFAAAHFQYDFYDVGQVFALGVALAVARIWSKNIAVSAIMHMIFNLISFVGMLQISHSGAYQTV